MNQASRFTAVGWVLALLATGTSLAQEQVPRPRPQPPTTWPGTPAPATTRGYAYEQSRIEAGRQQPQPHGPQLAGPGQAAAGQFMPPQQVQPGQPFGPGGPQEEIVLDLDRAIGIALANSPTLRVSAAKVDQARGQAIQAGLYPNPQQNSGNPMQLGGNNSTYSTGVTQEIVRGNKLGLSVAAAEQGVRQASLDFVRARFDLITEVRQQFFNLLTAQERLATYRDLQKIAQQSLQTGENLLKGGQGAETDVLLLRIELARIMASVQSTELAANSSRQQLAATMGTPGLRIDRVVGDLHMPLPNYDDPAVREAMLARSSLVESARADIQRSQILLRRAEAEPTPNLIFQGGYQYTVNQPHSQGLAGMYFTIPIWDRNQGNIRAAGATVRQSSAQLYAVQNDLIRQLADALNRYRTAQQLVERYEQGILPDARRTLRLVQQGYEQGQFDFLRILQTQRSLFEANLDYISAQQQRLTAAADIAGLLQVDRFP